MAGKMQAKVSLVSGMTFDAEAGSGHTVRVDASPDVGGTNQGSRPMELLLLGLGSCTGMDVISILRKMRQDVTGYEVHVTGEQAERHPRVFTEILVEHVVTGRNLDDAMVRKAVQLSQHKYCGASAMLSKVAKVEHTCRTVEAGNEDVADQTAVKA